MRKIYRMALELGLAFALLIPELLLIGHGAMIMKGNAMPEAILSTVELQGAIVMLIGWAAIVTVIMMMHTGSETKRIKELENRIKVLEGHVYGMDEEAEEES